MQMHIFNGCTSRAHCKLDLIFINYKAEEVNTKIGLFHSQISWKETFSLGNSPNMLDKKNHRGNRRREKERDFEKNTITLESKEIVRDCKSWITTLPLVDACFW